MKTIIHLFENSVKKFEKNIFLWEKTQEKYIGTTYKEVQKQVYEFSAGLMTLNVMKNDRIALISEGRNDWLISELGILYSGAINVPISVKINEKEDLKFRLSHSEVKIIIVSKHHYHKVKALQNELKHLSHIILLDDLEIKDEKILFFKDIKNAGKEFLLKNEEIFKERWKNIADYIPVNICYTSGTTADPKGIILTHRNYTANVEQANSLMDIPESFKTLIILPWDHAFAHTAGLYIFMSNGASIASVQTGKTMMQTLKNIPINIKEFKPNLLFSVPALAKNFKKNIEKSIKEKGIENLFKRALKVAYDYNGDGFSKGKGLRWINKPLYMLYDRLIFRKIRKAFGGQLKFFIGGGALLDIELQKFFYAIGLPMYQGYGLSEASPIISSNSSKKHKLGSSGFLVENLELKICDEEGRKQDKNIKGEIWVKGENVMQGYWKNEKATKETIKDNWLNTGDLGYLDNDDFLYVFGRSKSLLIANDGEKFSPEGIEEAFIENSIFIDQCMLHNDQNAYTIALLVPNKIALSDWLAEENLTHNTKTGQDAILNLLKTEINKYKKGGKYENMFPERWLPSTVAILDKGFTEENHLLNSTLKIVRHKITKYYKNKIEYLLSNQGKNFFSTQNYQALKNLFIDN